MTGRTDGTGDLRPGIYGFCSWHRAYAYGVRVVSLVAEGRGATFVLYACGGCRALYGLTPRADRP
ncbi:hypothetical protein IAG44_30905 [Streptomyces roseirectus]|uniref:Uncharacterized protein n=1 Tax=Streptomyces roseirectus TaxID=2768066 RepID=A0A7H0ITW8_9ACTN|nr:hypothetical protein [Streptomyces roseirectus]QNP76234.1 hypothetical protein IAG44_30905 [Streptomyces roseirectus]